LNFPPPLIAVLLRALLPSWRFFDRLGRVPILLARWSADGEEFGPWEPVNPPVDRGLGALVLNARGNLRMACNSLVERLVSDLEDLQDSGGEERRFHESVSYRLVEDLVRFRSRQEHDGANWFQFKIVQTEPGPGEERGGDEILVSLVHEA
jgi:hypothetical protein